MNQTIIISTEEAKKASLAELLQKQRSTSTTRFFTHISSNIIPAMLQFYSICPENRAMLGSKPSAGFYLK